MSRAAADRRQSILQTAIETFGGNGFKGTTIKALARRAGIAPGSVYNYFSSKEDLFRAALEEGWRRFLAELQAIVSQPRLFRERFRTVLDTCFASLTDALPLLRGMLFEARQRRLLQENLERLLELLEGLIDEARRRGQLRLELPLPPLRRRLKIIVYGILTAVALAHDEALEEEVATLKAEVLRIVQERLDPEGQP